MRGLGGFMGAGILCRKSGTGALSLLAICASLLLAAPAIGATGVVKVRVVASGAAPGGGIGQMLRVYGLRGAPNALLVQPADQSFEITDNAPGSLPIEAGNGCQLVSPHVASCSEFVPGQITKISIKGGREADEIEVSEQITLPVKMLTGAGWDTLYGGSGPDSLISGSGRDDLFGFGGADTYMAGSGDDEIKAMDQDARIDCGGGLQDHADVGSENFNNPGIIRRCESVTFGDPPPPNP